MRKVLSFFVLAGVLLASSCSLKEDFRGNDSDFATLSFTVGEPGVSATRAIGDGTSVDALYYAVYDDKGNFIADLAGKKVGTTFPTTVEITLAKGQTYKIAFWAQDKDCGAYSFGQYGDIENIYIDYAGLNNDESRDAFFKTIDHKVVGDIALDVTLERPFAQINLGVTQEDWDNAAKAGIYVAQSKLVINNAATELNLFDGKVQEPTKVEYALANIPTQTLEVDLNKDGVKEAYKYLSLSYILVADQGQTANEEGMFGAESALVNATFSLKTNKEPFEVKVDNLPVQRNWRTNVIGEVLTGDIKFNIDVDPIFDGEEIYPDTLEEELRYAALNGGTVTLTDNVELKSSLIVADNKDMVIDLNGHDIINISNSSEIEVGDGIIVYGNLTIKGNGTVQGSTRAVWARSNTNARVIIEGGNYIGSVVPSCEVIYASGNGIIDIYGGTFEAMNEDQTSFAAPQFAVLNLHGNGKTGCDINVYGGTFVKFNPSDNISENPEKDFVEEGYYSVAKGENFIVVENPADVLVSNLSELEAALSTATGNKIIGLLNNITGNVTVEQKPDVTITIEGNGHNFDGTILVNGKSARYATAGLTIQNINFKSTSISADAYINLGRSGDNSTRYTSNVIVKNCTFEGYANKPVAVKSYTGGDHNISIIGCTVDSQMHSLAQLTNVEKGLQIKDCKVYSKNGANINNSPALEMSNCIFDVTGYAVRVGVNDKVNSEEKTFAITNSTLKSACAESDDAVIVIRTSATNAKLTLTSTTLIGDRQIIGNTTDTQIIVK